MWRDPGQAKRRIRPGPVRTRTPADSLPADHEFTGESGPIPAPTPLLPWFPDDDENEGAAPAGYRILRKLGDGSRSTVYLGRAIKSGPADAAIKLFSPAATPASIDHEIAVLDELNTLDSPHIVRLLDVASDVGGAPCMLLSACTAGDLSSLLHRRLAIEPGEAVTVLAPVIEALGAVHRAGWSHGAVRASSIRFDATGAPVLIGWGHGTRLGAPRTGPRGAEQREATALAVSTDMDRFVTLALGVLGQLSDAASPAATDALRTRLDDLSRSRDTDRAAHLADLLYDFAEPLPIALAEDEPTPEPRPSPTRAYGSTGGGAGADTAARDTAGRAGDARGHLTLDALGGIGRALRSVRPRLWLAAAVPTAALIAMLALGGDEQGNTTGRTGVTPATSGSAAPHIPSTSGGLADHPTAPNPTAGHGTSPGTPSGAAAIAADDPVAAAVALLATREECFRVRSVLCLDSVAAEGSVALEIDRNAVRALQEGREVTVPSVADRAPVLIERLGDSALLTLPPPDGSETKPASLLLQRGEAGWRIRSVLAD